MKKFRVLLYILFVLILTGCNKAKINDSELQILGVNASNIERIELIHGNIIIYPDLTQDFDLDLIEALNTALENTGDATEYLDEIWGIALTDSEAYAQKDTENYYVYIVFSSPQTLNFKNGSNKNHKDCDGLLFDMNNLELNLSKKNNFVGAIGYTNSAVTVNAKNDFKTLHNKLKDDFDTIKNGV